MAESKDLIFSGNFTGQHNGADYDVSYQCSHDIDSTYEDDIRDYLKGEIEEWWNEDNWDEFVSSSIEEWFAIDGKNMNVYGETIFEELGYVYVRVEV